LFLPTVPASFLTFADYPIYALYELAPPVGALSARDDQQLAGILMKIVGGFIIFGTASVLFFRWYRVEEHREGTV
jgi:putative membrane protein